jgi:PAS domain S-box-containing protein
VILWNPASERTFGWTADELVGRPLPVPMTPPDDRAESRARIDRTIAGQTVNGERVRRLTKDGDERWIDIYAAPLVGPDGAAFGIASQLVDVTERVRMEARLLQAQKMGAVGMLASGIAHDFNNTLTAVAGYAELIRSDATGSVRDDAAALVDVVDRGRQLTRQLLDFARAGDGAPCVTDVRDVVLGLEPLLRRLIGSTVAIELVLPPDPLHARIQVGQLEQALINLAINARDAMPDGGRIRIVLAAGEPPPGRDGAEDRSIGTVALTVEDTGVGIPPTIVSSIFEPFFTTKPVGAGTGLGLAMVRGFVETAGGSLGVQSELGRGTRFTIELPRLAGA